VTFPFAVEAMQELLLVAQMFLQRVNQADIADALAQGK